MALSCYKVSHGSDAPSSEENETYRPHIRSTSIPSSFFKYTSAIHTTLGSKTAALLFSSLEYRFRKHPEGFYKFISPCGNNTFYRRGDSLSEELRVNPKTVQRALTVLCTSYKSKTAYLQAKETLGEIGAFKGRPYLSYHDKKTGQTFYFREYRAVNSVLDGSYKFDIYITKCPTQYRTLMSNTVQDKMSNTVQDKMSNTEPVKRTAHKRETALSENTLQRIPLSLSLSNDNIPLSEQPEEEEKKNNLKNIKQPSLSLPIIDQMLAIWRGITAYDQTASPSKTTINNLTYCYHDIFSNSLKQWEDFCLLVVSSRYLMGETKQAFKLNLAWASKPDSIDKIMNGHFTTGDRKIMIYYELEPITDADPTVLKFKQLCLEKFGKGRYVSWIKPLRISFSPNREIVCIAPNSWFARHIAENDFLGFGSFVHELPIASMVFKEPNGNVAGKIAPRNAN